MIVADLIRNKDYDRIEWRIAKPGKSGEDSIFAGVCRSENGQLIPLDGDSYSEKEEVLSYEEFLTAENSNCLSVVIRTSW